MLGPPGGIGKSFKAMRQRQGGLIGRPGMAATMAMRGGIRGPRPPRLQIAVASAEGRRGTGQRLWRSASKVLNKPPCMQRHPLAPRERQIVGGYNNRNAVRANVRRR
jgi:hypothetical protein